MLDIFLMPIKMAFKKRKEDLDALESRTLF
jgi:hypothetical protein